MFTYIDPTIRERLTGLGGRMEIRSTPGKGSEVVLTVPLDPEAPPCAS